MAGGTIETTNGLTATAYLPDGSGAAGARIYRVESETWLAKVRDGESVIVDSATADADGSFEFRPWPARSGLWIRSGSQAAFFPELNQAKVDSEFQRRLELGPETEYRGRIEMPGGARRILLASTPFAGDVDAAGNFVLQSVPASKYFALVELDSGGVLRYAGAGNVSVHPSQPAADTLILEPPSRLLLEDFEDLDNRGRLGPVLGGGWWEAYDDRFTGGNSLLLSPVDAGPAAFGGAILDGGTGHARALRMRFLLGGSGSERGYPFAYAALHLGSKHYDLRTLDSLVFWARGNGRLRVELVQEIPGLHLVAFWSVDLDTLGGNVALGAADLTVEVLRFPANPGDLQSAFLAAGLPAYTQAPATFAEMGFRMRAVRFLAVGGDEFWIDDIHLLGPGLDDFLPPP
jgi:hypothetical protein